MIKQELELISFIKISNINSLYKRNKILLATQQHIKFKDAAEYEHALSIYQSRCSNMSALDRQQTRMLDRRNQTVPIHVYKVSLTIPGVPKKTPDV